jgi:hypothetical protein
MGYLLWVGLTFPPLLKYIHPRNLIRKLASLIGWRNHDIYNVSSSQVWPSHIIFTEAISLERSFLICLSSILSSRILHDISSSNATVYGSNTCDGAQIYF